MYSRSKFTISKIDIPTSVIGPSNIYIEKDCKVGAGRGLMKMRFEIVLVLFFFSVSAQLDIYNIRLCKLFNIQLELLPGWRPLSKFLWWTHVKKIRRLAESYNALTYVFAKKYIVEDKHGNSEGPAPVLENKYQMPPLSSPGSQNCPSALYQ